MKTFPASQLIINADGSIFHLHIKPEHLADKVILVGDQGRVDLVASFFDGLFQGIGYTMALVIMCIIRELLGSGTFGGGILNGGEGIRIIPEGYPAMQMVMPVGGFLTLGVVIAGYQWLSRKQRNQKKEAVKE